MDRWRQAKLDDLLGEMTPMEFILRFTFTNPDLDTTHRWHGESSALKANVGCSAGRSAAGGALHGSQTLVSPPPAQRPRH